MDIHGASQCFSHSTYLLSYAQSVILLAVRSYDISIFVFQHTKEYLRMVNGNSSLCDMCLLGTKKKGLCQAEISSSTGPRHIFSCCILSCESFSWEKVARCTTYLVLYTSIISFDQLLSRIPCLAGIDKKHVPQQSQCFHHHGLSKVYKSNSIYISTARHQRAHQNANKFQWEAYWISTTHQHQEALESQKLSWFQALRKNPSKSSGVFASSHCKDWQKV